MVAQELLDGADILPHFEQVGGEGKERRQRLILRAGRHVACHGQVREEGFRFGCAMVLG